MLPLFALALLSQASQDAPLPPIKSVIDVRRVMASVGYPVRTYVPSTDGERIEREGVSIRFAPGFRGDRFGLFASIKTPKPVEQAAVDAWVVKEAPHPYFRSKAVEGSIVMVSDNTDWGKIAGCAELKARIEGFFARAGALARLYDGEIGPKLDDGTPPLKDDDTLDRANLRTLKRSFAAWGWTADSRLHYAATGMVLTLVVDDTPMWARNVRVDGKPSFTAFELVTHEGSNGFPAPLDPAKFREIEKESLNLKNHADDTYYNSAWHKVKARTTIDLAGGVTLAELRRRIEAFAKAN